MVLADATVVAAAVAAAAAALVLLVGSRGSATGWLLLATAAALPWWLVPQPAAAVPFTLSLVVGGSAPALATAAGTAWPAGVRGRVGRLAVGSAVACAVLVGGLLPALVFDPVGAGCNACPPNLLELAAGPAEAFWRAAEASALVWGPALALLAGWRLRRAPPLARRHAWPMFGAAAGIGVLAAVSAARELQLPVGEVDATVAAVHTAVGLLVVAMAVGIAARAVLVRTAGRRMARAVLAALPDPAEVIDSLRRTVADPGLVVVFPRSGSGFVDTDGAPVAPPLGSALLRLERDGVTVAEIRYDPRLAAGSADLVRAAAFSAGLALECLAAQARLRAEVRDIVAVRARIVADGDAERHRLERNLHDGAQQQLVALGLMLATAPATGRDTAAAHAEIDTALRELRTAARGLFPAALGDGGVAAALRELGDHTRCPLLISGDVRGEVPRAVGMAVYQLVLDVTGASPAARAVRVRLGGGAGEPARVTVEVTGPRGGNPGPAPVESPDDDPVRPWLVHAEDRFVAARGRLSVTRTADAVVLEGTAPCVS